MLRPADTITFGEVLRLFEGPLAPLPCLSRQAYRRCEDRVNEQACDIRREFGRAYDAYRAIPVSRTLGQQRKSGVEGKSGSVRGGYGGGSVNKKKKTAKIT